MKLGPAIRPKPPEPPPEWSRDPNDKRFEIQAGTGFKRTAIPENERANGYTPPAVDLYLEALAKETAP